MSFLDRLLGRAPRESRPPHDWEQDSLSRRSGMDTRAGLSDDEQAVERYRYLLRTAPPDAIEQAHEEAFTQLTPEQRRLVLEGLSAELPAHERSDRDDPRSLARMATRAEMRRPRPYYIQPPYYPAWGYPIGCGDNCEQGPLK